MAMVHNVRAGTPREFPQRGNGGAACHGRTRMDPHKIWNPLIRGCTSWLESPRCIRSILTHHVGPVDEVRIRHLNRVLRHRRALLLDADGASYVCYLSLNLRWIR